MPKIKTQSFLENSEEERKRQLKRMLLERTARREGALERTFKNSTSLMGRRFGRLRVVGFSGSTKYCGRRTLKWKCVCECGNRITAITNSLTTGDKKSCGCLYRDTMKRGCSFVHGCARRGRNLPIYHIYKNMISRCHNERCVGFKDYGRKGISVCMRWRNSFSNFLKDMGHRPVGMSLDRIRPRGNYTKSNCRWATRIQQANNTTRNIFIRFDGSKMTISQWARKIGITPSGLSARLKRWPIYRALTAKPRILALRY